MIKRFLIIFFIFLYGCSGYEPIFSKKTSIKVNFIDLKGEKRLNQIIYKNIKNLENSDSQDVKFLNLKIYTQKKRKIHSKDSKGNPNKYKLDIETNVEIDLENNLVFNKNFIVFEVYDDFDSQFELKKYEKKTEKILAERLSEKIIVYLRTFE
tara:strand:+ start:174 stop:632 length:459 start_codon:yes stop_codon:yes gene_type:complete